MIVTAKQFLEDLLPANTILVGESHPNNKESESKILDFMHLNVSTVISHLLGNGKKIVFGIEHSLNNGYATLSATASKVLETGGHVFSLKEKGMSDADFANAIVNNQKNRFVNVGYMGNFHLDSSLGVPARLRNCSNILLVQQRVTAGSSKIQKNSTYSGIPLYVLNSDIIHMLQYSL